MSSVLHQERGEIELISDTYDEVELKVLPFIHLDPLSSDAMRFWEDWIDAANHGWKYHEQVRPEDWTRLAREIVSSLQTGNLSPV